MPLRAPDGRPKRFKTDLSGKTDRNRTFRKILVPIDGSPNSYRGLQQAVELAKKYDAEITLLHIIERPPVGFSGPVPIPQSYFSKTEEYAKALFTRRKKELESEGVKVQTVLVRGDAVRQILKISKGFDLIVIGSRGYGGLRKLFLGSVSSGVVNKSRVSVLVVRSN